ncbi:uncharacterized protein LAESUDRAFT_158567 [Laetiporus sulphureus 93-53]|uniref:Homeobox domain-containing protein n=1 Tax=Laetiporus sulphureus 93-53 TaxID=1314785 RepID=A0A165HM85_9APHY|nr:uncharacterized protein LAESUDRAFT_158567 [Laetiporus sulphureus 93-53]KZT11919.1 hypothetical protein LAESUDRAFT_158567 [Laetiporus sulphureus 93-53]
MISSEMSAIDDTSAPPRVISPLEFEIACFLAALPAMLSTPDSLPASPNFEVNKIDEPIAVTRATDGDAINDGGVASLIEAQDNKTKVSRSKASSETPAPSTAADNNGCSDENKEENAPAPLILAHSIDAETSGPKPTLAPLSSNILHRLRPRKRLEISASPKPVKARTGSQAKAKMDYGKVPRRMQASPSQVHIMMRVYKEVTPHPDQVWAKLIANATRYPAEKVLKWFSDKREVDSSENGKFLSLLSPAHLQAVVIDGREIKVYARRAIEGPWTATKFQKILDDIIERQRQTYEQQKARELNDG